MTIHHGYWTQNLSRTLKDSEWNENMICTKCHYLCTVVVHSALDNFSGHSSDASTSPCSGRTSSHTASHTTHKTFQNHGTIMVQWCRGPVNTRNTNKTRSCETPPGASPSTPADSFTYGSNRKRLTWSLPGGVDLSRSRLSSSTHRSS